MKRINEEKLIGNYLTNTKLQEFFDDRDFDFENENELAKDVEKYMIKEFCNNDISDIDIDNLQVVLKEHDMYYDINDTKLIKFNKIEDIEEINGLINYIKENKLLVSIIDDNFIITTNNNKSYKLIDINNDDNREELKEIDGCNVVCNISIIEVK